MVGFWNLKIRSRIIIFEQIVRSDLIENILFIANKNQKYITFLSLSVINPKLLSDSLSLDFFSIFFSISQSLTFIAQFHSISWSLNFRLSLSMSWWSRVDEENLVRGEGPFYDPDRMDIFSGIIGNRHSPEECLQRYNELTGLNISTESTKDYSEKAETTVSVLQRRQGCLPQRRSLRVYTLLLETSSFTVWGRYGI